MGLLSLFSRTLTMTPPLIVFLPVSWTLLAGVPLAADGTGDAAESIVNQTAVDVLRRLPVRTLKSCEKSGAMACKTGTIVRSIPVE